MLWPRPFPGAHAKKLTNTPCGKRRRTESEKEYKKPQKTKTKQTTKAEGNRHHNGHRRRPGTKNETGYAQEGGQGRGQKMGSRGTLTQRAGN